MLQGLLGRRRVHRALTWSRSTPRTAGAGSSAAAGWSSAITGYTLGAGVTAAGRAAAGCGHAGLGLADPVLIARRSAWSASTCGCGSRTPRVPAAHGPLRRPATMSYGRAFRSCGSTYRSAVFLTAGLVITWNVTNYVLTSYVPRLPDQHAAPLRRAAPTRPWRPRCRSGSCC
ncbi:hypothetical protein HBB16_07370 [Pseudonocardia sp. MCCB 268]|nr:hypothetical protein [Pseudonocardia cytotoxica]